MSSTTLYFKHGNFSGKVGANGFSKREEFPGCVGRQGKEDVLLKKGMAVQCQNGSTPHLLLSMCVVR